MAESLKVLDWPEAYVELATEPEEAIRIVEDALADAAALEHRRRRNVVEALRRFDTRLRLRTILEALKRPTPEALAAEIEGLEKLSAQIEAGG